MTDHLVADEIRAYLERRRDALNEEVRHYPTPIARCDVQLTALLETRDEVMRLLRQDEDTLVVAFARVAGRFEDPEARRLTFAASGPDQMRGRSAK